MDVFEAMEKRHSYRGRFLDKPVPAEDLKKIVNAGLLAPTGKNGQTTRFVIVDDTAVVGEIQKLHAKNYAMQQAKAYIVCLFDANPEKIYEGYSFEIEDCAAAVENMLLAITALGYASVWVDGWLRLENRAQKVAKILNIPDSCIVRIILPIGIPEKQMQQPEKLPFEKRACFNEYNL